MYIYIYIYIHIHVYLYIFYWSSLHKKMKIEFSNKQLSETQFLVSIKMCTGSTTDVIWLNTNCAVSLTNFFLEGIISATINFRSELQISKSF